MDESLQGLIDVDRIIHEPARLETAGYVSIEKSFAGKMPRTVGQLTNEGRQALAAYRQQMGAVIDSDQMPLGMT